MVALEIITGMNLTDEGGNPTYDGTLPDCPELALESLQLFLIKALQPEPAERFGSASEMEEQLLQILYEVAANEEGKPAPIPSKLFGADSLAAMDLDLFTPLAQSFDQLPQFRRSSNARWWSQIEQAIAAPDPITALSQLVSHSKNGERDAQYALIMARGRIGEFDKASKILAAIYRQDPFDPKLFMTWMQIAVLEGDLQTALKHARQLWADMPGEIAPRLALAAVHELLGQKADWERAASLYLNILRRDPSYVSAAFGLNRAYSNLGSPLQALDALNFVPPDSRLYTKSLVTQLMQIAGHDHERTDYEQLLIRIHTLLQQLQNLDEKSRLRVIIDLHNGALRQLESGFAEDRGKQIAGVPLIKTEIQEALRDNYKALGRMEVNAAPRIELIEKGLKAAPFKLLRL
jgi:serine/threonine-protein kinase PknG